MTWVDEKFSRQVAGKGFYAGITLQAFADPKSEDLTVKFDELASEYQAAVWFEISYAREQFAAHEECRQGLNVHVRDIHWQPVDTHVRSGRLHRGVSHMESA